MWAIYTMYYILIIKQAKENIFTNCYKSPKTFSTHLLKKIMYKWSHTVQAVLFKDQLHT